MAEYGKHLTAWKQRTISYYLLLSNNLIYFQNNVELDVIKTLFILFIYFVGACSASVIIFQGEGGDICNKYKGKRKKEMQNAPVGAT